MSDLVALFVLGMCTFYAVWLSMEFTKRSKLHLLWTIPVGFFGCFVALAIFSLVINQTDDFLFIAASGELFLPLPIWRLHNRRQVAPIPKEQAAPKEPAVSKEPSTPKQILTPAALFDSIRDMKSNLDLQTASLKKDKGDNLPPPEVSGSKYINPDDPNLKTRYNSYLNNENFILDDNEESEELPDGLSLGDEIAFTYTNAKGEFSDRRFVIRGFDGLYLKGWDLDKRNSRTFRIDRIEGGVVKISTGEVFYF